MLLLRPTVLTEGRLTSVPGPAPMDAMTTALLLNPALAVLATAILVIRMWFASVTSSMAVSSKREYLTMTDALLNTAVECRQGRSLGSVVSQTVNMPRAERWRMPPPAVQYGPETLGHRAMSNDMLAKLVLLTVGLIAAIAWLGVGRHVGCKVNCPTDISSQRR
jgi:hypothetical protein